MATVHRCDRCGKEFADWERSKITSATIDGGATSLTAKFDVCFPCADDVIRFIQTRQPAEVQS